MWAVLGSQEQRWLSRRWPHLWGLWPHLWGLGTGDRAQRVVTHERAVFREGKNESQDLELHLGAGARGPGVPGCVQGTDFGLQATCPLPQPSGQPWSLAITDASVALSREGGGLTEAPGTAAASSVPCTPAQPAPSPPPRSAAGPARWPRAGTHSQGSGASAASVVSCQAKDRGRRYGTDSGRGDNRLGRSHSCEPNETRAHRGPRASPPPPLTWSLLMLILGLAVSSGGCRATSPNFTVSGRAKEHD